MNTSLRSITAATCLLMAVAAPGLISADDGKRVDVDVEADASPSVGDRVDDAAITAEIKGKMLVDSEAEALNTNVDTADGVVTLSGYATTEEAKQEAGRIAAEVDGVVSVDNQLVVDPDFHEHSGATAISGAGASGTVSGGSKPIAESATVADDPDHEDSLSSTLSDAWITAKVKASLFDSDEVSGDDINVDVENGVVTLSGEVNDQAEKDLAIEIAQAIRGVRDVDASGLISIG